MRSTRCPCLTCISRCCSTWAYRASTASAIPTAGDLRCSRHTPLSSRPKPCAVAETEPAYSCYSNRRTLQRRCCGTRSVPTTLPGDIAVTLFASFRKCSFLLVAALPLAADGLLHACRAQEPRLEVRYP